MIGPMRNHRYSRYRSHCNTPAGYDQIVHNSLRELKPARMKAIELQSIDDEKCHSVSRFPLNNSQRFMWYWSKDHIYSPAALDKESI